MANYESDVTQFLRDLLEKNPELVALQKNNRATWWDKVQEVQDADQKKSAAASEAPKAPYAYFPLPRA